MKYIRIFAKIFILGAVASGCATSLERKPSSVDNTNSSRQKGLLCTLAEGKEGDSRNLKFKRTWIASGDLDKSQRRKIEGTKYDLEINTRSGAFSIGVQVIKNYKMAPGRGLTVNGYIHNTESSDSVGIISFSEADKGNLYSNVYCDFGFFDVNDKL